MKTNANLIVLNKARRQTSYFWLDLVYYLLFFFLFMVCDVAFVFW